MAKILIVGGGDMDVCHISQAIQSIKDSGHSVILVDEIVTPEVVEKLMDVFSDNIEDKLHADITASGMMPKEEEPDPFLKKFKEAKCYKSKRDRRSGR